MDAAQLKLIENYLERFEIRHIDLKAELVDHFANAVHAIRVAHPTMGFKEALMEAHRKFGGQEAFRKYLNSAKSKVNQKVKHTLIQLAMHYFQWPQILLLLAAFGLAHLGLITLGAERFFLLVYGFFLLQALYLYHRWRLSDFFLVRTSITSISWGFYFLVFLPTSQLSVWIVQEELFAFAYCLGTFDLLLFMLFFSIPRQLEAQAQNAYC